MTKIVFLQENSHFTNTNKVDILISPELYWVRDFDIPIDSMSEVISVVPSFFEDYFKVDSYKFKAIKIAKHKYRCFAYNEEKIVQKIIDSNLEFKNIKNIYFAQNELIDIFKDGIFYEINNITYAKQNNIIVKIPESLALNIEKSKINTDNITLSNHKIYLNQSSKYIDLKTAYILSAIFIVFSLINFSKTISISNTKSSYGSKIENLKSKYNLPMSKFQTKSIIKELEKKQAKYLSFISTLEYILNFKSTINTKLLNINYKNSKLHLEFANKNENALKTYILKKYKILSFNKSSNSIDIKINI